MTHHSLLAIRIAAFSSSVKQGLFDTHSRKSSIVRSWASFDSRWRVSSIAASFWRDAVTISERVMDIGRD
jgi:hypothetical protein